MAENIESLDTNIETPAEIVAAPAEKMLPQSAVNALVGEAKSKGYAKAQAEAQAQTQAPPQPAEMQQPAVNQDHVNSIVQATLAEQARKAAEAEEQRLREAGAQQIHSTLSDQMAKIENPEVHEALSSWTPPAEVQPHLFANAANVPDGKGVEVMATMANDPAKYQKWQGLIAMGSHGSAQAYLNQIGQSLGESDNFSKRNVDLPNTPQDQIKGSPNTSGGVNAAFKSYKF